MNDTDKQLKRIAGSLEKVAKFLERKIKACAVETIDVNVELDGKPIGKMARSLKVESLNVEGDELDLPEVKSKTLSKYITIDDHLKLVTMIYDDFERCAEKIPSKEVGDTLKEAVEDAREHYIDHVTKHYF